MKYDHKTEEEFFAAVYADARKADIRRVQFDNLEMCHKLIEEREFLLHQIKNIINTTEPVTATYDIIDAINRSNEYIAIDLIGG